MFEYYINKHIIKDVIEFRNPYKPVYCPRCNGKMDSFRRSCPNKLTILGWIARKIKGWDPRIGDMGRMEQRLNCEIHFCRGNYHVPDGIDTGCGYQLVYTLVDDCSGCFRIIHCLTVDKIVRL